MTLLSDIALVVAGDPVNLFCMSLLVGFFSACRLIQNRSTHPVALDAGEMVIQVGSSGFQGLKEL